jgi:hypothetical protein
MVIRWALWANSGTVAMGTVATARVRVMRLLRPIKGRGEFCIQQARSRK